MPSFKAQTVVGWSICRSEYPPQISRRSKRGFGSQTQAFSAVVPSDSFPLEGNSRNRSMFKQTSFRGLSTKQLWMDEIHFAPPKKPLLKLICIGIYMGTIIPEFLL